MAQLPPHPQRTRQPFLPYAFGHRPYPLRHPRHRGTFLPLIVGLAAPEGLPPRLLRDASNGTKRCRF
nr:hypothetical protein [Rhizobium rhizolycopersici]